MAGAVLEELLQTLTIALPSVETTLELAMKAATTETRQMAKAASPTALEL
eukprot:CAMPEP_0168333424 /NCGR_PEP_ID=MMETSP0213-20121227/9603_1 /TAXON_ID=151035 /ORGANISM="Euplotes harpa, Strain FSP1.4" /LENGTH=49 /DNA_ID=CAMNT_0008337753 /DNA_START=767 /DNA_END=916 /DNA_ORIENTATION=-